MVEMIIGILLKKITKSLELVWDGYYDGRHAFDFTLRCKAVLRHFWRVIRTPFLLLKIEKRSKKDIGQSN